MKNWNLSIKNKLIIFAVSILIPIIIVGGVSYFSAEKELSKELVASASTSVYLIDELINNMFDSKTKDMNLLTTKVNEQSTNSSAKPLIQKELKQYKEAHPEILDAYIGTAEGKMIMSVDQELPEGYDPRERPWYMAASEKKGTLISTQPYVDAVTKKVVVTLAKTLEDGSGVIAIDLNLESLFEDVNSIKIGEKGYSSLIDKDQAYIVHPSIESGTEATGKMIDTVFGAANGAFEHELDGENHQVLFNTNEITGWKIIGVFPKSELSSKTKGIFNTTVIILILSSILLSVISYLLIRSINRPIRGLMLFAEKVTNGDLTETIEVKSKDEIGQLTTSFNEMVTSLSAIISSVGDSINQVAASAEELTASAEQTNRATEQIASSIQEVAIGSEKQVQSVAVGSNSINEMADGVKHIAMNATSVSTSANVAAEVASVGNESIQTAVKQMNTIHLTINDMTNTVKGLDERSQQIGQIVQVITTIAEQTNLLALNAAIEAARAGEHGKGFAVVADEVRKLAEQSSQSAKEITGLIQTIQSETSNVIQSIETGSKEVVTGINVVTSAGEYFEKIQRSVNDVAGQIQEVSASSQQMMTNTDQAVRAINQIAEITDVTAIGTQTVSAAAEEQLASMEEISTSAASLSRMAEELQNLISKFKV